MKKFVIIIVFLLIALAKADAQYVRNDSLPRKNQPSQAQPYNFWSHTSLGGNFGLQFGNYTIIAISPLLNYHFNSSFVLGIGPIYQYLSIQDPIFGNYSGSIYGGRIAALYYLPGRLNNIFLMGEYDVVNFPWIDDFGNYIRPTLGIPLLGLGYRQPVGDRSYFTVAGLWDLSGSTMSPYTNPIILAGFDIGI